MSAAFPPWLVTPGQTGRRRGSPRPPGRSRLGPRAPPGMPPAPASGCLARHTAGPRVPPREAGATWGHSSLATQGAQCFLKGDAPDGGLRQQKCGRPRAAASIHSTSTQENTGRTLPPPGLRGHLPRQKASLRPCSQRRKPNSLRTRAPVCMRACTRSNASRHRHPSTSSVPPRDAREAVPIEWNLVVSALFWRKQQAQLWPLSLLWC